MERIFFIYTVQKLKEFPYRKYKFLSILPAKRVKCSTTLYSLPNQLNLVSRSSRLLVWLSGNFAARLTSPSVFITENSSKFGRWLWWNITGISFSQSETDDYFEWILRSTTHPFPAPGWLLLGRKVWKNINFSFCIRNKLIGLGFGRLKWFRN